MTEIFRRRSPDQGDRYLRDDAATGASLAEQLLACRRWCEAAGYDLVSHYVDEGVSGAGDPEDRPGFSALLGQIDIMVARTAALLLDRYAELSVTEGLSLESDFAPELLWGPEIRAARERYQRRIDGDECR